MADEPDAPTLQLWRAATRRFARSHREAGNAAFIVDAEHSGGRPDVDCIDVTEGPASVEAAHRLGLRPDEHVVSRHRRYLVDGVPVELATSILPGAIASGTAITEPHPGPGGIYGRLGELGHRLERFHEEVRTRAPSEYEARALQLKQTDPVLHVVRVAIAAGVPVEVCDTVMCGRIFVLAYDIPAA